MQNDTKLAAKYMLVCSEDVCECMYVFMYKHVITNRIYYSTTNLTLY